MKTVLISACILLFMPLTSLAGSEGVGGGEPYAGEFLLYAAKLARYLDKYAKSSPLESFYFRRIQAAEARWRHSLKNTDRKSLVIFVEDRPLDAFGVPKAAVYHRSDGSVYIHRPTWAGLTPLFKLELVAMELLGLVGMTYDRYEICMQTVREDGPDILKSF